MPDFETADEKQQLRDIVWPRIVRGVIIAIPVLTLWWQGSGWMARHWRLDAGFVRTASLLVLIVVENLAPAWLNESFSRDPRETPRLRWLIHERADAVFARNRILIAFVLGGMLIDQCLMLAGQIQAHGAFSGPDGLISVIIIRSLDLRWRLTDFGDEGAQFRSLVAVNRAFLVTLIACLGAIEYDAYRAGTLRSALECALLMGCMTLQLSLIVSERRAEAGRE